MVFADSTDARSLWVRGMDSFKARPLPGTDNATQPFWSPDNRSIGFFASGKLKALAYLFQPLTVTRLAWFDMEGRELKRIPLAPGPYTGVALSPNGRSALVLRALSNRESELLVVDLERGTTNRISGEHVVEHFAWSPDGNRVAYTENSGDTQSFIVVAADGGPGETVLPAGPEFRRLEGWTPDGKALIFVQQDAKTLWDIWVLPLEGDRQPRPYLRKPANQWRATVSPDMKWLCYNSDESGPTAGYVQAFPTPGRRAWSASSPTNSWAPTSIPIGRGCWWWSRQETAEADGSRRARLDHEARDAVRAATRSRLLVRQTLRPRGQDAERGGIGLHLGIEDEKSTEVGCHSDEGSSDRQLE